MRIAETQTSRTRQNKGRREQRKERQTKKRHKLIQNHRFNNKATTKMWTWNVQKTSFAANNRGRLKRISEYAWMNKVDILLLTEITANNNDIFWMGSMVKRTVIIHNRKKAITLSIIWTDLWLESGSQHWRTDRTTTVFAKAYRLMSVYHPLWHYRLKEINEYRHAIEEQIPMRRHDEWIIMGGDHNASVGKREQKSSHTRARGIYGCGSNNEAGNDATAWCEVNGMTWANSFMSHPD